MDSADPTQDELDAELKDLRAGLRAFGKELALHVRGMDMPKTPLEAERTARMVRATDQMLIQVYAPPPPPREARSGGSAPGSSSRLTYDEIDDLADDDDKDDDGERRRAVEKVMNLIRGFTRAHAQTTGFWPNGQAYDAEDPNWREPAESELFLDGQPSVDVLNAELLRRFNIQTRLHAEKSGAWPDGSPWTGPAPGFWSISATAQTRGQDLAPGEEHGPRYLPAWIVRRPP